MEDVNNRSARLEERVNALRQRIVGTIGDGPIEAQGRRLLVNQLLTVCNVEALIDGASWPRQLAAMFGEPTESGPEAVVRDLPWLVGDIFRHEIADCKVRENVESVEEVWELLTGTDRATIGVYGLMGGDVLLDTAETIISRCEQLLAEADALTAG